MLRDMERSVGVTVTAILMSVTNAMGWIMIDWRASHTILQFFSYTLLILLGYLFIWFYWCGRNWARISVLICSVIAIGNIAAWSYSKPGTIPSIRHVMIGTEAVLGFFLLYWLNTSRVRAFFHQNRV
jgi:hypothetical protein